MPAYLLLALISAFGYSTGSLFNKQAMTEGCGVFRVFAALMWSTAIVLLPVLFLTRAAAPWHLFYQPMLSALCLFSGASFWMAALRTGEVSLVAPLAGIKPVFNAFFTALLLGVPLAPSIWTACGLTALALLIMRTPSAGNSRAPFLRTATLMMGASISYALCDVCLQKWAHDWGALRFTELMFLQVSVLMFALIPRFGQRWRDLSCTARRHMKTGLLFALLPGICMGLAIGHYGHAPEVNVVYSSHALWSVLLVWAFGRHIGNLEHTAGRIVMLRRLAGALILLTAIALILFGRTS